MIPARATTAMTIGERQFGLNFGSLIAKSSHRPKDTSTQTLNKIFFPTIYGKKVEVETIRGVNSVKKINPIAPNNSVLFKFIWQE